MLGRKGKIEALDRESERRRVVRPDTARPFSYYTSRITGAPETLRTPARHVQPADAKPVPQAKAPKPLKVWLSGWSFWLLFVVVIVCAGKILLLSGDPKVIIVDNNATTATYVQPSSVYQAAAQKILTSNVTNRSKLTVDPTSVASTLKKQFPELLDVSVSIPLVGNRPVLYIQPAEPSLVLEATKGNFALNKNGLVLSSLHKLPTGIPIAVDQSGLTPVDGKQGLPSDTISFIQTVAYEFNAKQLTVSTFVLPANSPYELDARLMGKPYLIRFNLEADAMTQSGAVIGMLHQLGSTTPSQYIDARVPGRVYYK